LNIVVIHEIRFGRCVGLATRENICVCLKTQFISYRVSLNFS